MDELIARALSGEAGELERRRLEERRAESEEAERRFRDLAEVWRLTAPDSGADRRCVRARPSAAAIAAEAERRRSAAVSLVGRLLRRDSWSLLGVAAAAVLLVAGLSRLTVGGRERTFATGPGRALAVSLDDGSLVRVGPSSRLRVLRSDPRRLRLDGTAFFAAASDSAHPMVVATRQGRVRVLGTRFEVRAVGNSTRVVVIEGKVLLSGAGGDVEVGRGGMGQVAGAARPVASLVPDAWTLLDWPGGVLMFRGTPLRQVLGEVGAHFGRVLEVRDTSLAGMTVTASFDAEPFEVVVRTVCDVVGARCVLGDTVLVTR